MAQQAYESASDSPQGQAWNVARSHQLHKRCQPGIDVGCGPDGNPLTTSSTTSSTASTTSTTRTTYGGINTSSSTVTPTYMPSSTSPAGSVATASPEPAPSPQVDSSKHTAATAGAAVGGLAAGALIAFLLVFILIRRKYDRRLVAQQQNFDRERAEMADHHSDKGVPTLTYVSDPAKDKQLKDAQSRIKTLEAERNAASAFGDKLDGKAEQELLNGPGFGLSVLNEKINQLAMSMTVTASGQGRLGNGPLAANKSEPIVALTAKGPQYARDQFEQAIKHVINGTLHERVFAPFCFEASEQRHGTSILKVAKDVSRDYDQSMYARWRSMTHASLRQASEKRAAQSKTNAAAKVQQYLFDTLVETLLYAGMEPDSVKAERTAIAVHARVGEIVTQSAKLMTIVREEMSTNDYSVDLATGAPTKSLGLSARNKSASAPRVLLDAVRV